MNQFYSLVIFLCFLIYQAQSSSSSTGPSIITCPIGAYYNTTYSQCTCTNPSFRIDPTNTICVAYHCNGYHSDPKACSGHGRCVYPSQSNCPNEPLNDPGICLSNSNNPVESLFVIKVTMELIVKLPYLVDMMNATAV